MKISKEQLKEIIESHGKWLRREEGGHRADLSGAVLSGADLSGAVLSSADLSGADLRSADLRSADLSSADLSGADLRSADLSGADLRSADLSGAVLDKKYVQIGCIGSRKGITTYNITDDVVLCGCWNNYQGGSLADFEKRINDVYGPLRGTNQNKQYFAEYISAIAFFKQIKEI